MKNINKGAIFEITDTQNPKDNNTNYWIIDGIKITRRDLILGLYNDLINKDCKNNGWLRKRFLMG